MNDETKDRHPNQQIYSLEPSEYGQSETPREYAKRKIVEFAAWLAAKRENEG